jgi:acyl-CoA hydrolase
MVLFIFTGIEQGKVMTETNIHEERRSLIMSEIMTPDKVNFHGNVHGGHVLSLLDRVAYACASRYSAKTIVTLSVDQVVFKQPIYVGELVICYANVNYVGNTSLEVGIRVVAENLLTKQSRHTNTCFFTMVALDENGKPTKVPALTLNNDVQKRRFEEALQRKAARLKLHAKDK